MDYLKSKLSALVEHTDLPEEVEGDEKGKLMDPEDEDEVKLTARHLARYHF